MGNLTHNSMLIGQTTICKVHMIHFYMLLLNTETNSNCLEVVLESHCGDVLSFRGLISPTELDCGNAHYVFYPYIDINSAEGLERNVWLTPNPKLIRVLIMWHEESNTFVLTANAFVNDSFFTCLASFFVGQIQFNRGPRQHKIIRLVYMYSQAAHCSEM